METCPICRLHFVDANADAIQDRGMCTNCSNRLGVAPMPPARRRPIPCRGCNSLQFIRAIPREVSAWPAPFNTEPLVSLMTVTYALPGGSEPLNARLGAGTLEMYVCKGCGLVEWYCADPEHVPIGPQYMTEDVDYESGTGPYR